MNIIEAIESGKDFKRKSWINDDYYLFCGAKCFLHRPTKKDNSQYLVTLDYNDICAVDWEIKENKKINIELRCYDNGILTLIISDFITTNDLNYMENTGMKSFVEFLSKNLK